MLKILQYPHPALAQPAKKVIIFDNNLQSLAKNMASTMLTHNGLGLAAPQVGISKRLIIVKIGKLPIAFVNPELIESSDPIKMTEGCLSFENVWLDIERPSKIKFKYQDLKGRWMRDEADGIIARCILHEIDHLDGLVFIERQ